MVLFRQYRDMRDSIYKILQPQEWEIFKDTGSYHGSVHDQHDGFIHLCAKNQIAGTLAKHYKDVQVVILACFYEDALDNVKWEASRGGGKFPHVYGVLDMKALQTHIRLEKSETGEFILPENLLEAL